MMMMKGFEKVVLNGYDQLPQETKYRFAEIELSYARKALNTLYQFESNPHYHADLLLYNILVPSEMQNKDIEELFDRLLMSNIFRNPLKQEKINYFRYKDASYQKIRDITGVAFNTISKMRFGNPTHYPVFPKWNKEMLMRWELTKPSINVFNEQTIPAKPWIVEN
jgi:hypothetical protein